jgi:5-methyltetrahydropteroyltriglutamate--homocysteine methyltransferase
MAVKAALKDQETVGIDIVSDGELRRDNDIDYLSARISACASRSPSSRSPSITTTLRWWMSLYLLSRPRRCTRAHPDRPIMFSVTGGWHDNPDRGLRHLLADVARAKLVAMVEGTIAVRRTLPAASRPTRPEPTTVQGA